MSENARIFLLLTKQGAMPQKPWDYRTNTGDYLGESTVDEREAWIELETWTWNLERVAGEEDSVPKPSLLSFTKTMDRITNGMLLAMLNGTQLDAFIIVEDGSRDWFEMSMRLERVTITNYDFRTEASEKGGTVSEDWTLDYRYITFYYRKNRRTGRVTGPRMYRPAGAGGGKPSSHKQQEFKRVATELLESKDYPIADLQSMWTKMVQEAEKARNRPDGKSPETATRTPRRT